jgi:membrane associated rhomboid family serine protease/cytochrome c-type biogenesis protein CcmH/NrfG
VTDPNSSSPSAPSEPIALQRVIVTPVLLGLCVLVYVAMLVGGVPAFEPAIPQLISWGADYGPATLSGEWWRLVTSMFVHIGGLHLLLNGLCLWQLGVLAESLLGPARLAALYVLSGLGGTLVSLAVHPLIVSAGASGAIFGIAGALLAVHYLRKLPLNVPSLRAGLGSVLPFVIYNLLGGLRGGIDNAAHIGGLATGFLIGSLVPLPAAAGAPARLRTALTFGGVAMTLVAGSVAVASRQSGMVALGLATRILETGDVAASLPKLRAAVAARPGFAPAYFSLGFAYLHVDSVEQALPPLREAVRLDPRNADYANELGGAFFRLAEWDSALAAFSRTVELDSNDTRGYYNKGLTLLQADRGREAIGAFHRAVALSPDSLEFRMLLAEAYVAADSPRAGVALLDSILLRRPNDVEAHYFRGLAFGHLDDLERARADLRQVIALADTSAEQQGYATHAREVLAGLDAMNPQTRRH